MQRTSSKKECYVVFLVESEKFKLLYLPSRTSSLLSVLLRTRSAQRLSLQHFAAVPKRNIEELVPSVFFCRQPWFLPSGIVSACDTGEPGSILSWDMNILCVFYLFND